MPGLSQGWRLGGAWLFSSFLAIAGDCPWPRGLSREAVTADADAGLAAGYWYAGQRDPVCARAWFQRAVAAQPDRLEARYNLGLALFEQGEFREAAVHLGRALQQAPREERVRAAWEAVHEAALKLDLPLAVARLRTGDRDGAVEVYLEYLQQHPESPAARYQAALVLLQLGRYAEAERHLRDALEILPDNPSLLTALGMSLVRQKRAAEALEGFRRVELWRPRSALARLNTAVALADAAQLEAAAAKFQEVIQMEPANLEAHRQLGRVLLHLRRLDEARGVHLRAISLKPDDVITLQQLGLLETLSGDHRRAAQWYERAVASGAADSDTFFKLGKAMLELGRRTDAVAHLQRAVERDPNHAQALYVLMRALAQQDPERAKQIESQMRTVRESNLATDRARLLSNAALQATERQQWEQAVKHLREALTVCGPCADRPTLHRNLGLILAQAGDWEGAQLELEQARRLNPSDRDAALALQILQQRAAGGVASRAP